MQKRKLSKSLNNILTRKSTDLSSRFSLPASSDAFTLIEVLVVLGILVLILGFGITVGFDSIHRSSLRSEQNGLITTLERARSKAVNNIDEMAHGVHFTGTSYTLFEGIDWATHSTALDEVFTLPSGYSLTGPTDIIFAQLSVDTTGGNISVTDGSGSYTIAVNSEGGINN